MAVQKIRDIIRENYKISPANMFYIQPFQCKSKANSKTLTSPLPSRAPVLGSTATEPITIRSTLIFSSSPIGFPYFATPTEVQASLMVAGVNIPDSTMEKNPVLNRG